jgi:hypothetical protein
MKNKYTKPTVTTRKPATLPLGFAPIQESCACYRGELELLKTTVAKLNAERKAIDDRYLPTIQRRVKLIGENKITLTDLVFTNKPLFQSPKTRVFSDIKVGLRKQPGRMGVSDEAKTIAAIEKHCPEHLDTLAPATRKISKEALEKLPADLLKKLGVEVSADDEKVIVEPQDNDVEKAVAALIAEFKTADAQS